MIVVAFPRRGLVWEQIRSKILNYPEDEAHLGITWNGVTYTSADIDDASDDDESSSDESSDEDLEELDNVDVMRLAEDLIEEAVDWMEVRGQMGAMLVGVSLRPPLNVGTDSQSILLGDGTRHTVEGHALETRRRAFMRVIGGNARDGTLEGDGTLANAMIQHFNSTGYTWEKLTIESHRALLDRVEGLIDLDSQYWTRAGRMVDESPIQPGMTTSNIVDNMLDQWAREVGHLLYRGAMFDSARQQLRVNLESRYEERGVYSDAVMYVDGFLLGLPNVRDTLEDAVADSVRRLGGGTWSNARMQTEASHIADEVYSAFILTEQARLATRLSIYQRQQVISRLNDMAVQQMIDAMDDSAETDVARSAGDDNSEIDLIASGILLTVPGGNSLDEPDTAVSSLLGHTRAVCQRGCQP